MNLTERENEVLGLLIAGWSERRIAVAYGISRGTVRVHKLRIGVKLRALRGNVREAQVQSSSLHVGGFG